ncbi:hypothetical protein THARTR1_03734 [Trichoderma harzianum]|uniref:Uncharacterized protein n=1 Tax=Trichoderma harzianum TaxID=5544 RepID=A0A2K0UEJ3_TRIHA|nr:hypothetical protein THARTR1_03734 [Trichoderma harzianum]
MASDTELINSLTAEQARAILIYLSHNRSVADKVSKYAKAMRTQTSLRAICVQCNSTFDPSDSKNCVYHDGELEVYEDDDFWADHDEDCHGIIDSDEMREEFPEGFKWSCCNETGEAKGCQRGRHQADPDNLVLDDDNDQGDEHLDDEEESDDKEHEHKRGNRDESQNSGPNKRQKR